MRIGNRGKLSPYLDLAPLVDCLFLLLIFFLLTSSLSERTGFRVDLPGAEFSAELEEMSFVVRVGPEEEIFADGRRVGLADLPALFSANRGPVVVRADRNVRLDVITGIMDAAGQSGVDRISIATLFGTDRPRDE